MLALPDLRLGKLLARGGEGRVFEVDAPGLAGAGALVFKQFHRPRPLGPVDELVAYAEVLGAARPAAAARARSAAAWPLRAVAGPGGHEALGVVLPRAPEGYWAHHREGPPRPATLSYLAGDPDRIELAYGVRLPAPGSAERVGVVYALARLLDAWQGDAGPGPVAHGDLSAKNVLWALSPAPAVFVLDCDGAIIGHPARTGAEEAPRATTPNWDDPALAPGQQPATGADRYCLALAFLRVVGAANFPLQARQRASEQVNVDLELPKSWRKLPDMPALWELCERSLSVVGAGSRPAPGEWVAALETLLDSLGSALAVAVRQAQGDPAPAAVPVAPGPPQVTVPDVVVRPVLRTRATSTWRLVSVPGPPLGPGEAGLAGHPALGPAPGLAAPARTPARQVARQAFTIWGRAHRLALHLVRSPGRRRYGVRRLAGVVVLDVAAGCLGLFLFGMVVSPWIGL